MALSCYTFIPPSLPSLCLHNHRSSHLPLRVSHINASLKSSDSKAPSSTSSQQSVPSSTPYVESRPHEPAFNYVVANTNGNPLLRMVQNTESSIERVIFDFRFLALFAVADVYLAGTVMLIFGMGLYGLFISNTPPDVSASVDRALKGSSLFGMFALKPLVPNIPYLLICLTKSKQHGCSCNCDRRSLIQQSNDGARGKLFYMHDLINDLATSVSGKICCRSEFGDIPENIRHLSYIQEETGIKELPMEIGGLENLQTLTAFLVGKRHEGLSIKELEKFPNLQGKFTIKNLHNVVDAKEAEEANLKNKEKIEELELIWGKQSEDSIKVKVVLEMLQPPINLKSLKINLYGGTSFPNWLGNSSFSNMVSLNIDRCEYCMTLPPLGQLPSLKKLSISNLLLLETIGPEFYCVEEGERSNSTFQPFPSLEHMKFYNMPNWKDWISFEGINLAFPKLRTMQLSNCPELRGDLPSHLSCMEEIKIGGCYKILETPRTLNWLSTIKRVIVREDTHAQHAAAESYPMFISKTFMSSICLTHLGLANIEFLTAFPTNGLPTSLQSLYISGCKKLSFMAVETFQNYTSLVSLAIWNSCGSLTSFPLDGFPALQTLSIEGCRSMNSIYISESPSRRQSTLRSLTIGCHDSDETLKVNLGLDTLTNLEHLYFRCSGNLSFCEGVCLPSKLQSIEISFKGTNLHVKEWGLQDLTALSRLTIQECGEMENTLTMESLLPISLVSLRVSNMSFGLRHLSSLQHLGFNHLKSLPENCLPSSLNSLEFSNCQHLKSLPENCLPSSLNSLELGYCKHLESLPEDSLPASLKKLTITKCPLLEERYKKKENWSKIAHIPFIQINYAFL
ncbi:hypothetical protein RYX36_017085 [Vicia faba]